MAKEALSTDELGLLEAIHADPRNDGVRLVYADWIEEHGQPEYAEFIRLQCQKPYIGVVYHPPGEPQVSSNFHMPYEDQDAWSRLDRLLALAPHAYRIDRPGAWWEELYRGLPLLQEERWNDGLLDRIGPAARVSLDLHTSDLARWLNHPIMQRVEILRIWPEFPPDAERDADFTMNSHYDQFWADNIPLLDASPLIDRLQELHPCGCRSTGEWTAQSQENVKMCREFLEPRVFVEYSW